MSQNLYLYIMTQATDTDIRELKDLILGLDKKIADLTLEMRVGFSDLRGQVNTVEAKLEGKIDKLDEQIKTSEAKLEGKIGKLDERTQLGFWGFIFRGTALAALAALTAIFIKYLFPILPELPKS
jgi:hypothetical protein